MRAINLWCVAQPLVRIPSDSGRKAYGRCLKDSWRAHQKSEPTCSAQSLGDGGTREIQGPVSRKILKTASYWQPPLARYQESIFPSTGRIFRGSVLGDLFALSVLCHKGRKKCANKHLQVALGLQSTLKKKPVSLTLLTYRATVAREATGTMKHLQLSGGSRAFVLHSTSLCTRLCCLCT